MSRRNLFAERETTAPNSVKWFHLRRHSIFTQFVEENAVNLVYGFVALNDNFDLDGFDEKRQAALTALVACCPRKAAPYVIYLVLC